LDSAPDDWREVLAGEDTARLNHLKRVSTFSQLVDNYFSAQDKIRSGQIEAAALPTEDSTDEEWAEFRETQGIPTSAKDYTVELADGVVLGDEDQEVLDVVYPVAHELNLSVETVSKLTNAMLEGQAQQFHQMEIQQEAYRKEALTQLHSAWKGDYEVNVNLITGTILNSLPEAVREEFAHATLADGRKVFNSPEVMIAMAEWARTINPSATVVANNANPMQAITSEIAEMEKRMRDDSAGWHRDTDANTRYMQLIDARDKMKSQV